jgi:hypothetical protein
MSAENNNSPEQLPVPQPPPSGPPPPESWLTALLKYRPLVIAVVILVFFGFIFLRGGCSQSKSPVEPGLRSAYEAPRPLSSSGEENKAAPQTGESPPPGASETPPAKEPPEAPQAMAPSRQERPAPLPPPTPQLIPREMIKGAAFTQALIKILDDQLNQRTFGWRPNTITFGKFGLTDNVNNLQLGVLDAARGALSVLNENLTRFTPTGPANPRINEAVNYLRVDPGKFWFPSASRKYREALANLELFIEDLRFGRARFYTRAENLAPLLADYQEILGRGYNNLVKDTEADGSPVSWFMHDDYFYYAKGLALGMHHVLDAVSEEFKEELQEKNVHKLLEDAVQSLYKASQLSPWMVTNGTKDGLLPNHRANMSTYIGETQKLLNTLEKAVATQYGALDDDQ